MLQFTKILVDTNHKDTCEFYEHKQQIKQWLVNKAFSLRLTDYIELVLGFFIYIDGISERIKVVLT